MQAEAEPNLSSGFGDLLQIAQVLPLRGDTARAAGSVPPSRKSARIFITSSVISSIASNWGRRDVRFSQGNGTTTRRS